jgi:hypothetical protein
VLAKEYGKKRFLQSAQPQITYDYPNYTSEVAAICNRSSHPAEPESRRIRAVIEALPFETPKLTAVGVGYLTRGTFAERLERAIARSNGTRLIAARVIAVKAAKARF